MTMPRSSLARTLAPHTGLLAIAALVELDVKKSLAVTTTRNPKKPTAINRPYKLLDNSAKIVATLPGLVLNDSAKSAGADYMIDSSAKVTDVRTMVANQAMNYGVSKRPAKKGFGGTHKALKRFDNTAVVTQLGSGLSVSHHFEQHRAGANHQTITHQGMRLQ